MVAEAERTHHERGRRNGLRTLAQSFRFPDAIEPADVVAVLRSSPLVGPESIFGQRSGTEETSNSGSRRLLGFSPAPGFRFDVELTEPADRTFVVSFSQPDRRHAYLTGTAVWWVGEDESGRTVLREQINTPEALAVDERALSGQRPSLRRVLFFLVGHSAVMGDAADRISALASSTSE